MIFFGHVGLTVGVVQAFEELRNRRESSGAASSKIDLRAAAVLSLGPDILDKPVAIFFADQVGRNSRLFGHSILVASILGLALWLWKRKIKNPFAYWLVYVGHFILDRMWINNLPALFWPLLGFPPPEKLEFFARVSGQLFLPYQVGGELIGFTILLFLFIRHRLYERARLRRFLRTGFLN